MKLLPSPLRVKDKLLQKRGDLVRPGLAQSPLFPLARPVAVAEALAKRAKPAFRPTRIRTEQGSSEYESLLAFVDGSVRTSNMHCVEAAVFDILSGIAALWSSRLARNTSKAMGTALVISISLLATSFTALAQTGYVHGSDHCYYFQAPQGWIMDNWTLASQGVPMVFYPADSTWTSADIAMYTRPASQMAGAVDPIRAQVDGVVSMYRSASQRIEAKKAGAVATKTGANGELWTFKGYRDGGTELVVYFLGRQTVNYFVVQIHKDADVSEGRRVLSELASSYKESTDCAPCRGGASCISRN